MSDNNIVQPEGNYSQKYEDTNKIVGFIMRNFFHAMDDLLAEIDFSKVYEAGCGEGFVSDHICKFLSNNKKDGEIWAGDISQRVIKEASQKFPKIHFESASIYKLDQRNTAFDLVVASEVLEHLKQPEKALEELIRISRKYLLISVPREPIWRCANMARGKYLRSLGNTPGHIQHWSKKQIIALLSRYCKVIDVRTPFPWIMVLCRIDIHR